MRKPSDPPLPRGGFTLVELLAVIAILSILMALLVPAVINARRSARIVQVTTELRTLDAAIATFKQEFGREPPSRITLYPAGSTWDAESSTAIQTMWPQFDFASSGGLSLPGAVTLNGAECLVFFLGGIVDANGAPSGFSRNPAQPFTLTGSNRINPFFQFSLDRLIDVNNNNFREYRDPLNATNVAPYVYFSSYDGSGYPYVLNDPDPNNATEWWCRDNWDPNATPQVNLMKYAYYVSVATPSTAAAQAAGARPFNPSGHQIISAGFDGKLGVGGPYQSGSSSPLPKWGFPPTFDTYTVSDRDAERDNITNFSSGVLAP
jgi:general secretion pathway protein G